MVRVRVDEKYGVVIPRKVMEELGIEKGEMRLSSLKTKEESS